ncbi:platelet glycoprotein Ib beta chain [Thunnus thynnus]|uniref:platelet glycoprotein Ib beta chain n=1 Tax=Thunnus maccoyii TaxID=8240 RepID=UPI001C4B5617|nr:platelet glycoprotein Ib beta chain [Thunnus maccoyii]
MFNVLLEVCVCGCVCLCSTYVCTSVCMHWSLTVFFISECQLAVTHLASQSDSEKHSRLLKTLKLLIRMKGLLLLCLLFFCGGQRSSACPHLCSCDGSQVDCSARSMSSSSLPASFPAGTTELRLHNNLLTTLPNGLLDDLTSIRSVSLHGNPWVCDCGVLYLRAWLRRQPTSHTSHLGVNCSSPPSLRGRLVVYLTEEEVLDSCYYWYCDLALASQVCLFVFVLVQAALLVAVIVFLRKFERLSKEAKKTTEESFTEADGPRENEYSSI